MQNQNPYVLCVVSELWITASIHLMLRSLAVITATTSNKYHGILHYRLHFVLFPLLPLLHSGGESPCSKLSSSSASLTCRLSPVGGAQSARDGSFQPL